MPGKELACEVIFSVDPQALARLTVPGTSAIDKFLIQTIIVPNQSQDLTALVS